MKSARLFPLSALATIILLLPHSLKATGFDSVSRVKSGKAVAVMLTAYSTTLLANGTDHTRLRIAVTDSLSREITSADNPVRIYVTGDGFLAGMDGQKLTLNNDSAGLPYANCRLQNGTCNLIFVAGTKPDKVKVEARSVNLWPGSHEIHTLSAGFVQMKPFGAPIYPRVKPIGRMIGADISWLPELEARGKAFYDKGLPKDAILLLRDHGFNYIRLRVFVDPQNEKGYSPGKGFCDLQHTLAMAKRIHDAGMNLLLDFHYSDYWADPQQQFKPKRWENLDFKSLQDSVKAYTTAVILALKNQGTMPAMVQIGNEINHGILWPDGHIGNPDQLAGLLKAGVEGVEAVDPDIPVMMHIALGGQNEEAVFWLNNMIARKVRFDIIGLSYYPRWHGTLEDLDSNLRDLGTRYNKPLNVVEYSDFKQAVHDIVFRLPGNRGRGACIWEPLNERSGLFTRDEAATSLFDVYDALKAEYLAP